MAKKIQVKQILELGVAGLSQNNIAKNRHMSKSSVNDVFQIAQELNISYENVYPEKVYNLLYPDKHAVNVNIKCTKNANIFCTTFQSK